MKPEKRGGAEGRGGGYVTGIIFLLMAQGARVWGRRRGRLGGSFFGLWLGL